MLNAERKAATAHRILTSRGPRGLLQAFLDQPTVSRVVDFLRYGLTQHDYAALGRVASVTETVVVDGCRFTAPRALVNDVLRYRLWLGRYERPERDLIRRYLDPSRPVLELGGGLGIVACLINRRLCNPSCHAVVEANPAMLPVIEQNRQRHDAQFSILPYAIGYTPTVSLRAGQDCLATATGAGEDVPALSLREAFARFPTWTDCTVVCDIEGAEVAMIERDVEILAERAAWLIVEEHPKVIAIAYRARMTERLQQAGFRCVAQIADAQAWQRR